MDSQGQGPTLCGVQRVLPGDLADGQVGWSKHCDSPGGQGIRFALDPLCLPLADVVAIGWRCWFPVVWASGLPSGICLDTFH